MCVYLHLTNKRLIFAGKWLKDASTTQGMYISSCLTSSTLSSVENGLKIRQKLKECVSPPT
jgi:hypothetical protein